MDETNPLKHRLFTVVILEGEMVTLILYRDGNLLRPWCGDFRTAAMFAQVEGGIPVPFEFLSKWIRESASGPRNINHRSPVLGGCRD